MATRCDIIRDAMHAQADGKCADPNTPPPECVAMGLATQRDMYFRTQYDPSTLLSKDKRLVRTKTLQALQTGITDKEQQLRAKYGPNAPVNIAWRDFPLCLWNKDGSKYGAFGNKYIKRDDMNLAGYKPQPLAGGQALAGSFLKKPNTNPPISTSPMPVWLDRVLNPNLMLIFIFVLLVIIFAVLVYKAQQWKKKAPERTQAAYDKERDTFEKDDPYRGSKFESYPDPTKQVRQYIELQEASGYDMAAYRKMYSLPPKQK
jgi:hypothetical protein